MAHNWPKELLIWHCTVLSLGQMAQLIMIILSLTALIGSRCIPNGTHTLTITEPIWPMLQNVSKTLLYNILGLLFLDS